MLVALYINRYIAYYCLCRFNKHKIILILINVCFLCVLERIGLYLDMSGLETFIWRSTNNYFYMST